MVITSHRTLRQALCRALSEHGVTVSGDAPPGREALVAALGSVPHVVLVDVSSQPSLGLETCRQFRRAAVNTRLVALTPRVGPETHAARAAGADGVVAADVSIEELAAFLMGVGTTAMPAARRRGRPRNGTLSNREHEVLTLAASGLTDSQVAAALYVSAKTVKNHLHNLYAKLGARSRTEAVVIAARQGLITL
jgi:DNA-binding NarL/FixJ family response regulator